MTKMYCIKMPISKDYHVLCFNRKVKPKCLRTIMTYLSKEDELLLDKGQAITLERGNNVFNLKPRDIYCYGEVDFTTGSDDMSQIDTFPILKTIVGFSGIKICSDYNYDEHICVSPKPFYRTTETWHLSQLAQYAHASLNKPKRIVLFDYI